VLLSYLPSARWNQIDLQSSVSALKTAMECYKMELCSLSHFDLKQSNNLATINRDIDRLYNCSNTKTNVWKD